MTDVGNKRLCEIQAQIERLEAMERDFRADLPGWQSKHRATLLELRRWVESWPDDETSPVEDKQAARNDDDTSKLDAS
jgi:hypothetical protein